MEPDRPALVVHLVHGTFARGGWRQLTRNLRAMTRRAERAETPLWPPPEPNPRDRYWFEPESDFERSVRRWAGLAREQLRFERVAWSGNNSFAAREEGAARLRLHLRESRRNHPDARHLVVAHSHGGTVAVMALDNAPAPPLADGLLTLGTPFVQLMPPAGGGHWAKLMTYVGCTMPSTAYGAALLVAVSAMLRQVPNAPLAAVFAALSVLAIATGRAWLAILVVFVALAVGGPVLRSDLLGLGLFALIGGLVLPAVLPRWKALWPEIYPDDRPARLRYRLLALRTANDEASLTIGLAQALERLFRLAAAFPLRLIAAAGHRWSRTEASIARRSVLASWLFVILSCLVVGSVLTLAYDGATGKERTVFEFMLVAATLPPIAAVVALVIVYLIGMIPGLVLSFAAGPEAFRWPYVGLYAEPLPHAGPEEAMTLVIDVAASQSLPIGSLQHALHELPHIRRRVGQWIRSHASSGTDGLNP